MKLPAKYANARKALAECARVDEVKHVRNVAEAMKVYAFQAEDGELHAQATEIIERATRRLGELMDEMRKAGALAKGTKGKGRPSKKAGIQKPRQKEETLDDLGINKNLAKRARAAAKMTEPEFEKHIFQAKQISIAQIDGSRAVVKAAKADQNKQKRAARDNRERQLATKIKALPQKKYGVIVADPEWQFETYSEDGKDRAAENHYPTSAIEVIKARDVMSIAADHCVLALWATVPMLIQALDVMSAWGFEYKSQYIWNKDKIGTGYWSRNKHEILLIGTRGHVPAPDPSALWQSVIDSPVREHSAKPEAFLEMIEDYFPHLPKIELNRRGPPRDGWDAWGNEAEVMEAAQ